MSPMPADIQNEQDRYIVVLTSYPIQMCNDREFPLSSHNIVGPNHNSFALTMLLLQLEREWQHGINCMGFKGILPTLWLLSMKKCFGANLYLQDVIKPAHIAIVIIHHNMPISTSGFSYCFNRIHLDESINLH